MERHEVEALAEKVGLRILSFRNNLILGGTNIKYIESPYGGLAQVDNQFEIYKENNIWISTLTIQRFPAVCKMDQQLDMVLKAISDLFKIWEINEKENYDSILNATSQIQHHLLVTDVIDERHIHIKNKNLDFPPTKDQWLDFYTPIVESYYQSNTEWIVTLDLMDDGWLIYSGDLDVFHKPKQVETLEEAVKLVTAQYSPPRANLDPRKKYI